MQCEEGTSWSYQARKYCRIKSGPIYEPRGAQQKSVSRKGTQDSSVYLSQSLAIILWYQKRMEHLEITIDTMKEEEANCEGQAVSEIQPQEEHSLIIQRRLEERSRPLRRGGSRDSSASIFRFPGSLEGINQKTYQPELVSIGPYHIGKDHLLEFQEHKWSLLRTFLFRLQASGNDLSHCLRKLEQLEMQARGCYSENIFLSSRDFVEMMLLDGCFILEFIHHLRQSGDMINRKDPIFSRPWLIPVLISDLLKLENQLPYFVLDSLFELSRGPEDTEIDPLPVLALQVFELVFPRYVKVSDLCSQIRRDHLLALFYSSFRPTRRVCYREGYCPLVQSIPNVTQLKPSGVKFRSSKSKSIVDIHFRNCALHIPPITVNDFTSTIIINCLALEHCLDQRVKYFTDYISFMSCLINQPRDVAFLRSDGIITRFSQDDKYVADLFNSLGKSLVFNVQDCYLFNEFAEVDSYYSGYWASMRRTYFSSPWSCISVFSATVLLIFTMIQSIISILSYNKN